MKKLIFLAGVAVGVVVGSRLGRGPYDSLERTARQVVHDPEVQRRAAAARDVASRAAHDAATAVKEKAPDVAAGARSAVAGAAGAARDRVVGDGGEDELMGLLDDADADAAADGADRAADGVSGGDAEVGDQAPLSS
ncbi:hypothetical protein ACXET9_05710 [Brachybacterium sp. DNPG3]